METGSTMEKTFNVSGMTCKGCEYTLEKNLIKEDGVSKVKADFVNSSMVITFKSSHHNDISAIKRAASKLGYELTEIDSRSSSAQANQLIFGLDAGSFMVLVIGAAILIAGYFFVSKFLGGFSFPAPGSNVSLLALFTVGLFTGIHCVGMCGGFVASASKVKDGVPLYLGGKLISYTLVGGLLGLLGASIMIGQEIRGVLALAAGLFMIIFGLSSLGVGFFKKLYTAVPKPNIRIPAKYAVGGPFVLGFLNGFMPCGPLMAMQVYALSTGSLSGGAIAMFVFGVGTIPFMAGFGAILSKLGSYTGLISKASALIVIILGFSLLMNGYVIFADNAPSASGGPNVIVATQAYGATSPPTITATTLSGASTSGSPTPASNATEIDASGAQIIRMSVMSYGYEPQVLYAKPNTKTKFIVDAKQLSGCNSQLQIPAYNIFQTLKSGENIFEFTTGSDGTTIDFACGMNMLKGRIIVASSQDSAAAKAAAASAPKKSSGGCGCGG